MLKKSVINRYKVLQSVTEDFLLKIRAVREGKGAEGPYSRAVRPHGGGGFGVRHNAVPSNRPNGRRLWSRPGRERDHWGKALPEGHSRAARWVESSFGLAPRLVLEGRLGVFQNSRLREPPETHRGHISPVTSGRARRVFRPPSC